MKTILKAGCEEIGATFALQDLKIRIPKGVPPPKKIDETVRPGAKAAICASSRLNAATNRAWSGG